MKEITIKLYSFNELKPEVQQKVIQDWREHDDLPFLADEMQEKLNELLKDNKIEGDAMPYYSLSYCQGDGAMFEGSFFYNGVSITVKQAGHYYNENSKELDFNYEGLSDDDVLKTDYKLQEDFEKDFNDLYVSICEALAKYGYAVIEHALSDEVIKDTIIATDYTFEENGVMRF